MSVLATLWSLSLAAAPCDAGIPFTVQVDSKFDGDELTVTAALTNCGELPLTHQGLTAHFDGEGPELREFGALSLPSDHPVVKPHTVAHLQTTIQLQRYAYEGAPTFKLAWSINGLEANGTLSLKLPKRAKGATFYFIDHAPVSKAAFVARQKQLKGQEKWMCAERSDGGQTSYLARDGASTFRVTERSITVGITGGVNSITRASPGEL